VGSGEETAGLCSLNILDVEGKIVLFVDFDRMVYSGMTTIEPAIFIIQFLFGIVSP
jgi:hypothetical protein